MADNRDLAVPDEVAENGKAVEVLRAWVANGGLVCALRPTTWSDPGAWGIVLADAAKHVARTMRSEAGIETSVSVEKIREMFNRELISPTDEPTGRLVS